MSADNQQAVNGLMASYITGLCLVPQLTELIIVCMREREDLASEICVYKDVGVLKT